MSALDWRTEMTTIAEYGDAQVKSANAMGRRRSCSVTICACSPITRSLRLIR